MQRVRSILALDVFFYFDQLFNYLVINEYFHIYRRFVDG